MPAARLTPSLPRALSALMLREMATSYGRSPGGYLWAVVEPVAAVALLSFIFSMAFDAPPLGRNFPLFYASGYLPFILFLDLSNKIANAVRFSRPLMLYPALRPTDTLWARFALNLIVHIVVALIVLAGIEAVYDTGAIYDAPVLAAAFGLAALLAFGVGAVNAFAFARLPVWERLWQIAIRPLFVISGIFFLVEDLPPEFRGPALMNPLLHVTSLARAGVYPSYDAALAAPALVALGALAAAVAGLFLLTFSRDDPANA